MLKFAIAAALFASSFGAVGVAKAQPQGATNPEQYVHAQYCVYVWKVPQCTTPEPVNRGGTIDPNG